MGFVGKWLFWVWCFVVALGGWLGFGLVCFLFVFFFCCGLGFVWVGFVLIDFGLVLFGLWFSLVLRVGFCIGFGWGTWFLG